MQEITTEYLAKQIKFKTLAMEIQTSLNSKEYLTHGQSLNDFVKEKWNISK